MQGSQFKHEIAYKEIHDHFEWREKTFPIEISSQIDFLNSGAFYCLGRATSGQVIIVQKVKKLLALSDDPEVRQKAQCCLLDWIVDNMLVPGHIESWITITDFSGIGITDIPIKMLKTSIG